VSTVVVEPDVKLPAAACVAVITVEPILLEVSVFPLILATVALPEVIVNAPLELDVGKLVSRLSVLFADIEANVILLIVGEVAVTVNVPVVDPDM